MKNVTYFLLGIALVVLTSATTVSIMTVKPAKPKSVVAITGNTNKVSQKILEYSRKGYIFKFGTQSQAQYTGYGNTNCLVVMEKY